MRMRPRPCRRRHQRVSKNGFILEDWHNRLRFLCMALSNDDWSRRRVSYRLAPRLSRER